MQLKTVSIERYDAASNCDQLDVGDPVWLYCPQTKKGLSLKLMQQWQGPYLVTKRINDMVYRVQLSLRSGLKLSTGIGSGFSLKLATRDLCS